MAVESPAAFNQAGSYSAEQTRRAIYGLLSRGSTIGSVGGGLIFGTDAKIKAAASELKSEVAPGEIIIPGSSSSTQSGYYARVSSETVLSHAASDATNPRIDRVSAIIKDKAYTGTEDTFSVALVTGTPEAGATLANLKGVGAAPTSSYTLGYVLVPAKATALEAVDIKNVPIQSSLGVAPLHYESHSGSYEAKGNEVATVSAPATVTLPPVVAGQIVAIYAENEVKIKPPVGANIQGVYGAVANPVINGEGIILVAGTAGNWYVLAGEPQREQKYTSKSYTKAELTTGVVFNVLRPVLLASPFTALSAITVGGVSVTGNPWLIPPNVTFKATLSGETIEIFWIPL